MANQNLVTLNIEVGELHNAAGHIAKLQKQKDGYCQGYLAYCGCQNLL
jgi:hypothetical protein